MSTLNDPLVALKFTVAHTTIQKKTHPNRVKVCCSATNFEDLRTP